MIKANHFAYLFKSDLLIFIYILIFTINIIFINILNQLKYIYFNNICNKLFMDFKFYIKVKII